MSTRQETGGKKKMQKRLPGEFESFSYMPYSALQLLGQDVARKEDWGRDFKILKNYIKNTYNFLVSNEPGKLLVHRGKSAEGKEVEYVVFNTGLFDRHFHAVYGVFMESDNSADVQQRKYVFKHWWTEQQLTANWTKPRVAKDELPDRAVFIQSYSDTVFDPNIPLIEPQIKHILADDAQHGRLQAVMKSKGIDTKDNMILTNLLTGAIETAKKRVKENFRTVVPQYYRDRNAGKGTIQLLLPLHLGESDLPDLVMPITKVLVPGREGSTPSDYEYHISTILTLAMAYNNARLICRIESEWLRQAAEEDAGDSLEVVCLSKVPPPSTNVAADKEANESGEGDGLVERQLSEVGPIKSVYVWPMGSSIVTRESGLDDDRQSVSSDSSQPSGGSASTSNFKTILCRSVAGGSVCRFGARCSYAHSEEELRPRGGGGNSESEALASGSDDDRLSVPSNIGLSQPGQRELPNIKSVLCRSVGGGSVCKYGAKCKYAHSEEELRPRGDRGGGGSTEGGPAASDFDDGRQSALSDSSQPGQRESQHIGGSASASNIKTILCRSVAGGSVCRFGAKCMYAHSEEELRPRGDRGDDSSRGGSSLKVRTVVQLGVAPEV
jgi:hypothetical protein